MKRKRLTLLVGICSVLSLTLVMTLASSSAMAENTIVVGSVVPLSGASAAWGTPCAQGLRIGSEEVNASGGIVVGGTTYKYKFYQFDSKLDPVEAVACVNKLIDSYHAKFISFGGSGSTLAAQPVCEAAKVFMFTQSWTDKQLGPKHKYTFRFQTGAYEPVSALYKWLGENDPDATIAVTNPSYEGGYAHEKEVKDMCKYYNLKLVFSDFYPTDTMDFTPILTKVAKINPTYYDTGIGTATVGLQVKQLSQLGWSGRVISVGDCIPSDLVEIAGPEALGKMNVTFQFLPWGNPEATAEQKTLYKKFMSQGGYFNKSAVSAYTMAFAYKEAAEATQSFDPDKIAAYMETHSFDTILGTLSFPEQAAARYGINHQIDQPAVFTNFVDTKGNFKEWMRSKPVWRKK